MNREVKFRGISTHSGKWVYGNFIHSKRFAGCGNEFRIHNQETGLESDVIPETVGQFTGLYDKNELEIYEGDIVKHEKWVSIGKYEPCIGMVKYKIREFTCECIGDWRGSNADLNSNAEIIGNIYENPELLQTKN